MKLKHPLTFTIRVIFFLLLMAAIPLSAMAIGSKKKTPAEEAAEVEKKALSNYNDGVKKMKKAREKAEKGDSTFAYNYRATSNAKAKKEYEKAIKKFNSAIELKPNMAEAHNNLGYCYRKIGKYKESLESYDKALAIDNNFAQAREYRGELYLALDKLDKANSELLFLQQLKSPYADTLQQSIEEYKLHRLQKKMEKNK